MGDRSQIAWTDATWNPVTGCRKIRPGCAQCYAERDWKRVAGNRGTVYWNRAFTDVACHPERLSIPFHWRKPRLVFVNSMSDLFEENVPDAFIDHVFAAMVAAPQHVYQVLTKRDERMQRYMSHPERAAAIENRAKRLLAEWRKPVPPGKYLHFPPPHIWLGVSCETQPYADECSDRLRSTPAAHRFISFEPLLEAIDPALDSIDWVIAGGESGPNARRCNLDWLRAIACKCRAVDVPCFIKQLGARPIGIWTGSKLPIQNSHFARKDEWVLRDPKGADPSQWPTDLASVRDMPEFCNAA